jgi:predicted O-methyltransferase YrrM
VKRSRLIAVLRLAAAASVATLAASLVAHAVAPALAPLVAVAVALFVILAELGRLRASLEQHLMDIVADVTQLEPLLTLSARLVTRQPLPAMRGYAIAPDFALILTTLVADEKPELVVETGSGVSTLVIAYALEKLGRGRVVALDHDARYADRTRALIERHGLGAYAKVVNAPLEELDVGGERHRWYALSALDGLDGIDLVVDDGPPKYAGKMLRYASLPLFRTRLSARGIFVLDVVGDEEKVILERWKRELPEWSQEHLDTKKGNVIIRHRPAPGVL